MGSNQIGCPVELQIGLDCRPSGPGCGHTNRPVPCQCVRQATWCNRAAFGTVSPLAPIVGDRLNDHLALAEGTGAEKWVVPSDYLFIYNDRAHYEADAFGWGLRRQHGFKWDELEAQAFREYDPVFSRDLGFAVRLDKECDFIGRQACAERKANPAFNKRLVQILLRDPDPLMVHGEIVRRNGKPVGDVRAASYGHTLGGAVGLALVEGDPVDADYLENGDWSVDIAGRVYPATVSLRPLYDPGMERVRS